MFEIEPFISIKIDLVLNTLTWLIRQKIKQKRNETNQFLLSINQVVYICTIKL